MHIKFEKVIEILAYTKRHSQRDYVAFLLAFRHGLRATEVVELTTKNFRDGYLTVKRLKGSEKTTQMLFGSTNPLLDEATVIPAYLATIPEGEKLFPITREHLTRLFKERAKDCRVPEQLAHIHSLKHAVAHHLVSKTPLPNLQKLLGHKSLSSTGMYLKVSDQAACEAVAAAF
jgi:integrase